VSQDTKSFETEDFESPFLYEYFFKASERREEYDRPTLQGEDSFLEAAALGGGEVDDRESPNIPHESSLREHKSGEYSESKEQLDTDSVAVEHFAISRKPVAGKAALFSPAVGLYLVAADEAVHEDLTRQASKFAEVPYDSRLEKGCRWPDVPCSRKSPTGGEVPDDDTVATCYNNFLKYLATKEKGTVPYRSHQGDLQIWHSMSLTSGEANSKVRDRILKQVGEWYEKGRRDNKNGLFHVGRALHTIQDSFSRAHTWRAENKNEPPAGSPYRRPIKGEILAFQDYNAQEGVKHRTSDQKSSPSYEDALWVSIVILKFFKKKEPFYPRVYDFLRNRVYVLAPGYGLRPAGGSAPEFEKSKNIRKEIFEGASYETALEELAGMSPSDKDKEGFEIEEWEGEENLK
jgi:hypothetical protein